MNTINDSAFEEIQIKAVQGTSANYSNIFHRMKTLTAEAPIISTILRQYNDNFTRAFDHRSTDVCDPFAILNSNDLAKYVFTLDEYHETAEVIIQ